MTIPLVQVDAFADAVLALDRPVDVLIANAGIMACPLSRDGRGTEAQLRTNFIGHALLTSRLAPALRLSRAGRVISLTSHGHQISGVDFDDLNFHRRAYEPWAAYGQSKTASVLLAVKAQRGLAGAGVSCFAVNPGVVPGTELLQFLSEEALARAKARSTTSDTKRKTVETGAATTVWAAVDPAFEGRGPLYLEDCQVAQVIQTANGAWGVMADAMDPRAADRLWSLTEDLLGRKLPL